MLSQRNHLHPFHLQPHDGIRTNLGLVGYTVLFGCNFPLNGRVVWDHPLWRLTTILYLLGSLCLNHCSPLGSVHFYKKRTDEIRYMERKSKNSNKR